MLLRLNPALDPAPFARFYAAQKAIQIPGLFEEALAYQIEAALLALPWRLICQNDAGQNVVLTRDEIAAMSAEQRRALEDGIRRRAAENFGFTYFTYPMIEARLGNWNPGHPIHALTDFLNSAEFIAFAKTLIGEPRLIKIDCHATNYQPGHFLTRHVDEGDKYERRAAYTIGLSRKWEPDWSGLLLFLDEQLNIKRGFTPGFNVLTVFDGLMPHTVTAVSTFAPAPRLSIAGWFRDDTPAKL